MLKMGVVAFTLVIGLAWISCSDDTTPQTTDKGGTVDLPVINKEAGPAVEQGPAVEAGQPKEASAAGACVNATDGALIDTKEKRDAVTEKAKNCGLGCIADPDKVKCATDCVVKETQLSAGCSACYVGIILCTFENCLAHCAADPSAEACVKCQNGENPAKVDCYKNFYTCSGLTPQ